MSLQREDGSEGDIRGEGERGCPTKRLQQRFEKEVDEGRREEQEKRRRKEWSAM